MAQYVKDPALSLQLLGSLLWHSFDPWTGELLMSWMQSKKKKQKKLYKGKPDTNLIPKFG